MPRTNQLRASQLPRRRPCRRSATRAVGLFGKQRGLLGGKLELKEDVSYKLGTTKYDTWLVNGIAPAVGNTGTSPTISSKMTQVNLTATYMLSHSSDLLLGYLY